MYDLVNDGNYIRAEQDFEQERELEFRNRSEELNTKSVYWTLVQVALIAAVSLVQLQFLKGFFKSKKLV